MMGICAVADKSGIEWTDATWNPIVGCSIVSPGCKYCYAMKMAARIERMGGAPHYDDLTQGSKAGPVWTGKVALAPDHILTAPLRWKRGRKIFVNSMGDLFHESIPDEWIDRVFAIMALCPQHAFQVLTKRAWRMRQWFAGDRADSVGLAMLTLVDRIPHGHRRVPWPLPNVWLGVSTERQQEADERIPLLLQTPAAVRFISAEPLLAQIDIRQWIGDWGCGCGYGGDETLDHCPNCGWVGEGPTVEFERGDAPGDCPECNAPLSDYYACPECKGTGQDGSGFGPNSERLDWIIVGGESGSNARPMHPDWARSLRDQCTAAGVPFFFKQWGGWWEVASDDRDERGAHIKIDVDDDAAVLFDRKTDCLIALDGHTFKDPDTIPIDMPCRLMTRLGKKSAGRLLDGKEHNEFPIARGSTPA